MGGLPRHRGIELRETVWISLHTDSETVARSKADRAWSQMIEAWEARLVGKSADADARMSSGSALIVHLGGPQETTEGMAR
ncbi:hypothetical protein SAMN05444004_11516 [Jannaschia faecimaris]|uniref:Uncharacterized protein n=1 Tax=Jannaschia faecimaris TaxID=1244108 RepID=A0A1H3T4X3_9RHOB|nr:hypothetical protein SAMN05444004_11516 [Jannaschia faecimaris]